MTSRRVRHGETLSISSASRETRRSHRSPRSSASSPSGLAPLGDTVTFAEASKSAGSFGLFLRSLVGLDRAAAEHFEPASLRAVGQGFAKTPATLLGLLLYFSSGVGIRAEKER